MDYKELLVKYISHVSEAEGSSFATDVNLSPCGVGVMEFTREEKDCLEKEIFPKVRLLCQ